LILSGRIANNTDTRADLSDVALCILSSVAFWLAKSEPRLAQRLFRSQNIPEVFGDDPYSGVAFGDGTSGVGGSARASALGIKDGNRSAPLLTNPGRSGGSVAKT
jgi:hypothetical protein